MVEHSDGLSAGATRPIPAPKYATILADPPWLHMQVGRLGAQRHYPLMTTAAICALQVEELAAGSAHLWLWVTNASTFDGRQVMESWGFQFRSILTWVKPVYGLGGYLRTASEHVLFGIRGRAPMLYRSQPSWFFAPRQSHSHKPEEIFAIVERCSAGPYLELFARTKRAGWHAWGNEVESDVMLRSRGDDS